MVREQRRQLIKTGSHVLGGERFERLVGRILQS